MQEELELMWAAGFWDGEGCCYAGSTGDPYFSISQVNRENLERFRDAVGGGNIGGPYGGHKENHRPHWQWRSHGRRGTKLMAPLLGLISTEKRRQFERVAHPEDDGQLRLKVESKRA